MTGSHTSSMDGDAGADGDGGGGLYILKVEPKHILNFFCSPLSKLNTYKIPAVKYYF